MKIYVFSEEGSFDDQTIAYSNKRHAIREFNYRAEFRDKECETSTTIRHGYGENGSIINVVVAELKPTKTGFIRFFNSYA
mgnify:FL=1|tara:strand:- start:47 stop:286 length:240 start_codon:yes stop_codon:yes gene_type:complete